MLKIGLLGFGFMGVTHYRIYQHLPGAEVVGIFDLEPGKVGRGEGVAGNIGDAEEQLDLSGVKITGNADELIEAKDIDIIDVCLPTFVHADFAVKALEAGKHVFCEKPMALTPSECDMMIDARDESGKKLMIGHCIRFWPEYVYASRVIKEKKHGEVISAFFRRLSPTPSWSYESWILQEEKSGGALLDLHIHDIDYIYSVFGNITEVSSSGVQNVVSPDSGVGYVLTKYQTGSPALVTAEGGWHFHEGFPFNMSFHIRCEEGTLLFDAGQEKTLAVCTPDGKTHYPAMPGTTGWDEELKYFVECVKDNKRVDASPPEESKTAVETALMEHESLQINSSVRSL